MAHFFPEFPSPPEEEVVGVYLGAGGAIGVYVATGAAGFDEVYGQKMT